MKKGFTLMELIAVIIVLGIIALIAVPVVTNIVNEVKEKSNFNSIEAHLKNINNELSIRLLEEDEVDGTYTFEELNFSEYPEEDDLRCSSYKIERNKVVKASNCVLNDVEYCYNKKVDYCPMYLVKVDTLSGFTNGDIGAETGENEEHRRRMRSNGFYEVEQRSYKLETLQDYKMVFYEYDENQTYLSKYTVVNKDGVFTPLSTTKYVRLVLRAPSEKTMSNGQWYTHFTTKGVYFHVVKIRN